MPKNKCFQVQVLVVDDNPFNVYSLQLLLREFFALESDDAYSGPEGIQKFLHKIEKDKEPYKLILTDINMPEMDGFQMAKEIMAILDSSRDLLSKEMTIHAVTAMNDDAIRSNF